jgi:hypothetical protein
MKIKYIIYPVLLVSFVLLFVKFNFNSSVNNFNDYETYSQIKIFPASNTDFLLMQQNDITLDHYTGNYNEGFTLVLNQAEIRKLKQLGIRFEIEIYNLAEYYSSRPAPSESELMESKKILEKDNITGFTYGSLGGYYTYAEIVQKLDSMRLQYPNLISVKQNIGTTHESRVIWAVKISDNPDVNESATEPAIYFDALHHAREPQSMAGTMYFMYWLLENYSTNSEARYLVDNREIFFVPCANPDGYVYNQSIYPNANWRKNRRNNGGNCYGVDLNRNYNYGWGYNNGSSSDPCSETYRGPSAASEPETQAIKNFVLQIQPKISFSEHSYAGRFLNPYGYTDTSVAYEMYSDFSGDFASDNNFTYGTVIEMLNYYSSGTTRDWLHSVGCYSWTPEVGGSSFWPNISEIIPLANEMLSSHIYLTWVGGAYAKFQNYSILNPGFVQKNDTLRFNIGIRNKGLSIPSQNVTVSVTTSYPHISAINNNQNYGSINPRQIKYNTVPFSFRLTNQAAYMDEILFIVSTKQENVQTSLDTISVIVGKTNVLFFDNAETNGTNRWLKSGNQIQWDTSFVSYWSEYHSFADSRYGNSRNSTNNYFTLADTINLIGLNNPRIEFMARWATETNNDYVRIQISTNFGSSWINLPGRYTSLIGGQPSYHGVQHWIYERINLNPYIGQRIRIRFNYITNSSVPGDGFYFDNFRVVNYIDSLVNINPVSSEIPNRFELYQNYPNPFNPVTVIKFDIPAVNNINFEHNIVQLVIYDVLGKQIKQLVNQSLLPGRYEFIWDASEYASGIYFYKLNTAQYQKSKSMLLIK